MPDPALFSSELRYLFISGFGTYLSATEPAIRTRGMVVGEEISKIVSASFAKEGSSEAKVVLDFELEGDDVEALRRLARENVSDDSGKTVSEVLFQTSPATVPTLSIAPETVAPTLGVDDRDPDSDDESNFGSEDSFIPYDFEPDEFPTGPVTDQTISVSRPQPFVPPRKQAVKGQDRVKIAPPVYVRELVSYLRAGNEDVTKQEMALVHCLSVVRAMKDLDWKEHGVELITWLLRAEDNFELDGFHAMRQEAMREVASRGPSTVVPALVSAFYDRTLAISQRLEVLDVLASAAAALSSLADDPADDDPTLLKPTVNAASSPHQEDTEKIAERIAGSTRRFSKKSLAERSKKPPKPNKWSKHAETAVLGLVGRLGSRANGWDPTRNAGTEMPLVLDRLLACATAMVWCSANIPSLPRLCRELFDFAWSLRSLRTANEQQWGASDDSDFDVAIPRSNIPSTVALAVTVSFSMLSQVSYGQVGTLDLFNSVFSDAEVERAASWAIDLMEDGTGGQDHREKAIALVSVIREVLEARRREIFGEDVAEIL